MLLRTYACLIFPRTKIKCNRKIFENDTLPHTHIHTCEQSALTQWQLHTVHQRHGANDRQVISFSYTYNKHTVCHVMPVLRIPCTLRAPTRTTTEQRHGRRRHRSRLLSIILSLVPSSLSLFLIPFSRVSNERAFHHLSLLCVVRLRCRLWRNLFLEYVWSYFHLMALIWPERERVPPDRLKC